MRLMKTMFLCSAVLLGLKIMGTIGILGLAYEDSIISKEEITDAIEVLRDAGRHISEKTVWAVIKTD